MTFINTSNPKFWPKTQPVVTAVQPLDEDKPPPPSRKPLPPPDERIVTAIERALAGCDVVDVYSGDMARIGREIAAKHGITIEQLKSHRRQKAWTWPRHEFCWRVHKECPQYSYPQIGRWLGGRDHTTIANAVRKHEDRIAEGKA